ncbi:hypothetical protein Tco_0485124 [Tanacetum coccineum]
MPTEMELTLEQTQQGVSYEVSVDPHIFEGIFKDGDRAELPCSTQYFEANNLPRSEPLLLSFDFVFDSEIFKSLSFSLDRLCHLAILCLDQHAHTLHLFESLLTISFDRLDIFKEDLVYQSLQKSLSLYELELS